MPGPYVICKINSTMRKGLVGTVGISRSFYLGEMVSQFLFPPVREMS